MKMPNRSKQDGKLVCCHKGPSINGKTWAETTYLEKEILQLVSTTNTQFLKNLVPINFRQLYEELEVREIAQYSITEFPRYIRNSGNTLDTIRSLHPTLPINCWLCNLAQVSSRGWLSQ